MGGFYMTYLESMCRRRGWRDPLYETYRSSSGYTCLVLVNGREYQTDLAYESDGQAQENAAMRAFMVCRNFSVNGGMLARNGVVQGLPASEHSDRHRRRRNGGRSHSANFSSSSSITSGARRSCRAESIYSDASLFSSASEASSSSTISKISHSSKESSSTNTDIPTLSVTTPLPPFVKTPTTYRPSLMESTAADESLGLDRQGSFKLESGEDKLDVVHRSLKAPEQSTALHEDRKDGMKSRKPVQDEGCEYDSYPRDSGASVKTHIWASSSSASAAAPKNQILLEQTIFQYFVDADTAGEGFWERNDDFVDDFGVKDCTPRPLIEDSDLKIQANYGIVGLSDFTPRFSSDRNAKTNIKVERNMVGFFEEVEVTPNEVGECERDDDHAGGYCSNQSSSTENKNADISESDESDSQASFYQRVSAAMSIEGQSLEQFRQPILDRERRSLVDRAMEEFWVIFSNTLLADSESPVGSDFVVDGDQVPSNGSDDQRMTMSSLSSTGDQITSNGEQKRKRDEQEENENNNNQRKQNPPESSILPPAGARTVRFACPFRKHNPRIYTMYTHRSCALSGWTTIARIKEHIYRSHRKRPYCQRCWLNFENQQELDLHMTVSAADICEVKPGQPPDGITAEHERKLRSRKKACPTQSNEETWRDMYKILFPDEDVPSPYFELIQEDAPYLPDANELADYEDYIRRELPSLVRRNLEEIVCRETQPLEASLIANLVDIVRSCQEIISRSYRERSETGGVNQTLVPQSADLSGTSAPSQFEPPSAMDDHFSLSFMTPIVEDPTLEQWDGVNVPPTDFQPLERSTDQLSHDSGYGRSLNSCSCHGACSCQSVQKDDPESSVNEVLPAGTMPAGTNSEQNGFLEFMSFSNRFLDFTECDDHLSGMNG